MALTWKGGLPQPVIPTKCGVVLTLYPAFNVATGLSSVDEVEVRRAPDNAGVPGTPVTIDRLPPLPARGYVFVDDRPLTTDVWWYSHRHIKADGAIGGSWSTWEAATSHVLYPNDQRLLVPPAADAGSANTSSRYRTHVSRGASQVFTNGVEATLSFDTELYDNGNLYDGGAPTKLIIPAINNLGVWAAVGLLEFAASAVGTREAKIKRSGTTYARAERSAVGAGVSETMNLVLLIVDPPAGDYIEMCGTQGSGGNLNVTGSLQLVHLW